MAPISTTESKKKHWITNGFIETCTYLTENDVPKGWQFGRLKRNMPSWNRGKKMSDEVCAKCKKHSENRVWYNNGETEIFIKRETEPPIGFHRGRLPLSENTRKKISAANKGCNNPNFNHRWTEEQKNVARERAKLKPIRWTEEQKKRQAERLRGRHSSLKGKKRNPKATQKWLVAMRNKTEEEKEQWKIKEHFTKKKNHSFNSSKIEKRFYQNLCNIYSQNTVIPQYRDERYPFNCDFYIANNDLFIECNFHWTHGGRPYDPNNPTCQAQLKEWQEKAQTSQFYKNAIETWTVRDVEKQKCAKQNNLNYEAVYEWNG